MKYLKKFESKRPIDVDTDVAEFEEKFKDKLSNDRYEWVKKDIKNLVDEFGYAMTDDYKYYSIYNVDDYGRNTGEILVTSAVNKFHSFIKASVRKNNIEILTTGFYESKEVDIKSKIEKVKSEIEKLNSILADLESIN